MDDKEVQEILERLSDYFSMSDPILNVLRLMGFGLIKLFYMIINFLEKAVESVYTLGGLIENSRIEALFNNVMPIAWALLTVAILIYGYQMLTGTQLFKKEFITNILLAIGIFALLPWLLVQLNGMTKDIFDYARNEETSDSQSHQKLANDENSGDQSANQLATQLLKTNINDVLWIAKNKYQLDEKNGINNNISEDNLHLLSINEKMNTSKKKIDDKKRDKRFEEMGLTEDDVEVFDKYIAVNSDFEKELKTIPRMEMSIIGNVEWLSNFYYRYTFNPWSLLAQFIAIGLALIATSFKVVRLFMEITFSKILAPFIATTDLSTGQRMRALLKDILINYSALALIPFVMQIYIIGVGWLTTQDFNWVVTSIIIFAMSYFLIDGPEVAKKILGIDLGVQDGWRTMMGALAVGTAGAKGVGLATKGASAVAGKVANNEALRGMAKGAGNLASAGIKDTVDTTKKGAKAIGSKASSSSIGQDMYGFGKKAKRRYGEMADAVGSTAVGQGAKKLKDGAERVGQVAKGESNSFKAPKDGATTGNVSAPPEALNNALSNVNASLNNADGANDPKNAIRNVSDIANNQPTDDNDRQQLISAMLQGASTDEAQQRINEVLNEITDPQAKQQMISSLMASNDVGLEAKNQLVSSVMSGAIDGNPAQMVQDIVTGMANQHEKQQQMIDSVMTNTSIPNESKQQLIDAVMTNKDMSVDSKTQLLETMTSHTPSTESKTQLINSVATGEATAKQRQAYVNEVYSSAERSVDTKIQNVNELINSKGNNQETATKLVNTIHSNSSDPAMQTQMINRVMQGADQTPGLKTQFISQAVTGNALNNDAKTQLVNTIFNGSGDKALPSQQQRVLSQVLSSDSGVSHKTAYLNEVYNKSEPVANSRSEFVNMIRGSNIDTGTKEMIVNQAEFGYGASNPEILSRQINTVMNTEGLDAGLRNNIIHEISNPSSVYQKEEFRDIITKSNRI